MNEKNYLTILFPMITLIMMMIVFQFFGIYLLKPHAYININKRVRKLYQSGFLEEVKVPGGFLHGARNYKISEKGFVFLFAHNVHLNFYKYFGELSKTKLFQIFIAPYFDNNTIQECTSNTLTFHSILFTRHLVPR